MKALVWLVLATTLASPAARSEGARQILFIAGASSHGRDAHEFMRGSELLATALNEANLPLRAQVALEWPSDLAAVRDADVLVLYSDGLDQHVAAEHAALLQERLTLGRSLVVLHFALEPPENHEPLRQALVAAVGAVFEPGWSVNPVWRLTASPNAHHPVAQGVDQIAAEDEWYYHLRFRADVQPVLSGQPTVATLGEDGPRSGNPTVRAALAANEPQIVAWTVANASGARGFGFTGGHFHRNWYEASFRTLVLNGIVWAAGLDVPENGVASSDPAVPLHETLDQAIARGDVADVRRHLRQNPDAVAGQAGRLPPLHQAILRRQTEIAQELLAAGASIHKVDTSDRTPLHLAVIRGDEDLVAALLHAGATTIGLDQQGWSPLHHAAAKAHLAIVERLLEHGVDPNIRSRLGGTPLHEAAASGAGEVAERLLAAGTDPTLRSATGMTATEIARAQAHASLASRLEQAEQEWRARGSR